MKSIYKTRLKRLPIFVFILIGTGLAAQTQNWEVDLYGRTQKMIRGIPKGRDVHISSVEFFAAKDYNSTLLMRPIDHFELVVNDRLIIPRLTKYYKGVFSFYCSTKQEVWDAAVIDNVLDGINLKGYQNDVRNKLLNECAKYKNVLKDAGVVLKDVGLNKYVRDIIFELIPDHVPDTRSLSYDLMIIQNPAADSYMFPDGTLVLNTGLIAAMHTRDELAAVIARELAHYVLDHSVQNYKDGKLKHIFIGAVSNLVSDAINSFTGVQLSLGDAYYSASGATGNDIANADNALIKAVGDLGMEYSEVQEDAADWVAQELMRVTGFDADGFPAAMYWLGRIFRGDHNYARRSARLGTLSREVFLQKYGEPYLDAQDLVYERIVAVAVTYQAQMLLNAHKYGQAEHLARHNIENNAYTDDDCLILAECLLARYSDEKSMKEVLELVRLSHTCYDNIQSYKPEVIAKVRLGKFKEAVVALELYSEKLDAFLEDKSNVKSPTLWEGFYYYYQSEKEWIRRVKKKMEWYVSDPSQSIDIPLP